MDIECSNRPDLCGDLLSGIQMGYEEEVTELGKSIMEALGGKENIEEIDNCISRLRLVLKDTSAINENGLKKTGSLGIIRINEKRFVLF